MAWVARQSLESLAACRAHPRREPRTLRDSNRTAYVLGSEPTRRELNAVLAKGPRGVVVGIEMEIPVLRAKLRRAAQKRVLVTFGTATETNQCQ